MNKYLIITESGKNMNGFLHIVKHSYFYKADNSDQAIANFNNLDNNILVYGYYPDYTIITNVIKIED